MNQHTPEPWTFDPENGRVHGLSHPHPQSAELGVQMQSTPTVAYIRGYHGSAEANANGRLIAAAPDLLAAGKELSRIHDEIAAGDETEVSEWAFERWSAGVDALLAAIAKAEGSSP